MIKRSNRNATKTKLRSKRAVASLEIAIAAFLMIIISALSMDIVLLNFATCLNDAACRDAARAAGQTNNLASAIIAANAQLKLHATDGVFVGQPTLMGTTSPYFVYNDYTGSPPANTAAYVIVMTQTTVKVPVPIVFFGASFYGGSNNTLVVKRRYRFPIVNQKFYG